MCYSHEDLTREIKAKIELLCEQNASEINPDWIAMAVLNEHRSIMGPDQDFFIYHARAHVRDEVRRQLNRLNPTPDFETAWFPRRQEYYMVARNGEQCAVHATALTDEEYEAKLAELHAMAQGCINHAKELKRYWETRRAA